MCGLAAVWGQADDGLVGTMLDIQRHRGPDGVGLRSVGADAATLGHCRLAIIDPAGGAQPLESRNGEWCLIANGMIYNDKQLRRANHGTAYRTGSDSESILHLVASNGCEAVGELDGMFAFVMTDGERLIAARDPIGIKPLYLGRSNGTLAFASEAKALTGKVDEIREFPAGHTFDSERGLRPYYTVPETAPRHWREDDAVAALTEVLEQAVVKRLRSDVPFGALLSGGLDSSIIAALAAKHVDQLDTFAVGLEGSPDLAAARTVARHIGSRHYELVVTPEEAVAALPEVLYHLESFDQDLVRSALPCFLVSRFAAEHVKVVLTGEGADELFAGYRYYRDIEDDAELHAELRSSVARMHNINLQRVDRMSMAHGLEARVPFLDRRMIALGLELPTEMKLKPQDDQVIEKWILRRAFQDLLPAEIAWRTKLQFDQGSGIADFLAQATQQEAKKRGMPEASARSTEESYYRALLEDQFEAPGSILDLVAHWDTRLAA